MIERVSRTPGVAALIGILCGWHGAPVRAQKAAEPERGWANETELSLTYTEGNSSVRSVGFGNRLRHRGEFSRFRLRMNTFRTDTADDPFFIVVPAGIRFPLDVSEPAEEPSVRLVEPSRERDVEKHLISGRYDREISERFFWNVGGSWDRNSKAGIRSRYNAFGGVGNDWRDDETLRIVTTYGVSYIDREEDKPTPWKDARFGAARFGWEYRHRLLGSTVLDNELTANVNLTDAADYSLDTVGALSVDLNDHLSLRVTVQLLYENIPASEDVDLVLRVRIVDPDGIPDTGDGLFETVEEGEGGILGSIPVPWPKDRLDTIVRTALVIRF